jgi:hypothetical protein
VATPIGDTPYLAEETGAITIVPVRNPEMIVKAIKDSMKKGALSSDIIAKAQIFIQSISWERQSILTNQVFIEAIENKTN